MYEQTINEILSKDVYTKNIFKKVLARNELPDKPGYPSCYVVNTQPREKPGEHWLAIHFDDNGTGYFYDSYGMPPVFYGMQQYMKKNSNKFTWNMQRMQGLSNYCGFYCIFFLLFKCRNDLKTFFNKFKDNLVDNDKYIFIELNKNLKNKIKN